MIQSTQLFRGYKGTPSVDSVAWLLPSKSPSSGLMKGLLYNLETAAYFASFSDLCILNVGLMLILTILHKGFIAFYLLASR